MRLVRLVQLYHCLSLPAEPGKLTMEVLGGLTMVDLGDGSLDGYSCPPELVFVPLFWKIVVEVETLAPSHVSELNVIETICLPQRYGKSD